MSLVVPGRRRRRTFELLIQPSPTRYAEGADELFEVDRAVLVLVEHIEDIVRELARITEWEELLVYPSKFVFVELPRWAILQKASVPFW